MSDEDNAWKTDSRPVMPGEQKYILSYRRNLNLPRNLILEVIEVSMRQAKNPVLWQHRPIRRLYNMVRTPSPLHAARWTDGRTLASCTTEGIKYVYYTYGECDSGQIARTHGHISLMGNA